MFLKAIHSAGRHMEDHIIAAHSAFIIGYILIEDESLADEIKNQLNKKTFDDMIVILKKFLDFMRMMV